MNQLFVDVVVAMVTGLVSGILTLIGDRWLYASRLRRLHSRLAGRYRLYPAGGEAPTDEVVEVDRIGDRVVRIASRSGPRGEWDSRIEMSDEVPENGFGTYQYRGHHEWGHHSITYKPVEKSIIVFVHSVSHAGQNPSVWYELRPDVGAS